MYHIPLGLPRLSGRFLKKLMGGSGVVHAVARLDKLMQQEALIVAARGLNSTNGIDSKVMDTCNEVLASGQGAGNDDSGGHSQRSGECV